MIFPILKGLVSPTLAPMTFLLFALNLMVFVITLDDYDRADHAMDNMISDSSFLEVQGSLFSVMIDREQKIFTPMLQALAKKALDSEADSKESKKLLGSLAIRNIEFMNRADTYEFGGDQIAIESWRRKFTDFKDLQDQHPSYLWGISRIKKDWIQFVTYQFAHSGVLHLFWNMVFLLVFGAFVETTLGGSFVILTYLGSGLLGAYIFSFMSGISSAPLVGASAAVSGLIALVGFGWLRREKLKFFFWLLPMEGYFGFVNLPSWLIIIVSLIPDVTGYLGASREFGSVAYSAHIGGAVWGAGIAALFALGVLKKDHEEAKNSNEKDQTPKDQSSNKSSHDSSKKSDDSQRRAS